MTSPRMPKQPHKTVTRAGITRPNLKPNTPVIQQVSVDMHVPDVERFKPVPPGEPNALVQTIALVAQLLLQTPGLTRVYLETFNLVVRWDNEYRYRVTGRVYADFEEDQRPSRRKARP